MSLSSYRQDQYAQREIARRAYQAQLLRQVDNNKARLAAAQTAREAGDIRRAAVYYRSLAYKKPVTEQSKIAKEALAELREEGRKRLDEIDYDMAKGAMTKGDVAEAMTRLRQLDHDYGAVGKFGREIRYFMNRARRRDEVAAVLNEPDAKQFWTRGQKHEQNGAMCCAYLEYEVAAKLAPAPSALKAKTRFEDLSGDPDLVDAAKRCSTLKQCHRTYSRAERLIKVKPRRAAELFEEVLETAPHDTEIHLAARKQFAALEASF